jgi:hypothetical protein
MMLSGIPLLRESRMGDRLIRLERMTSVLLLHREKECLDLVMIQHWGLRELEVCLHSLPLKVLLLLEDYKGLTLLLHLLLELPNKQQQGHTFLLTLRD